MQAAGALTVAKSASTLRTAFGELRPLVGAGGVARVVALSEHLVDDRVPGAELANGVGKFGLGRVALGELHPIFELAAL
jgi:hypothetical protein